jgi:hypothetical protein
MISVMLIAALLFAAPAAEKKRDWKEAKILDVKADRQTEFRTGDPRSGGAFSGVVETQYFSYVVDLDGTRFELREQSTKPSFNTGDTLRFAIEKKNWFYTDQKGKEKKGDIVGRKEVKGGD